MEKRQIPLSETLKDLFHKHLTALAYIYDGGVAVFALGAGLEHENFAIGALAAIPLLFVARMAVSDFDVTRNGKTKTLPINQERHALSTANAKPRAMKDSI